MGTGEDPDAVSAGSTAPAAAGATEQYGDIVVTANKREQNLSDVGLSVTALGSQALANQRIATVADLAQATPGLTFAPTPNATPVYTLRGVGFYDSSLASYPDVAVYIDQRSEEHTSELQSLMRISYAVFCLKQKNTNTN